MTVPLALYSALDGSGRYRAEPITRGPWDPGLQHGGPPCGLLGHAVEVAMASSPLVLSRLSVELLAPVPVAEFDVETSIVRNGRRVAVVDATLHTQGRLVARASSQWVQAAHPMTSAQSVVIPGDRAIPERGEHSMEPADGDFMASAGGYPRPGFNCDAVETRLVTGSTEESGPGCAWFRLRVPVVDTAPVTPITRLAAISDLAAAAGWEISPNGRGVINTDVTIQLVRHPLGEWICMDSRIRASSAGTGFCDTLVFDDHGVVGRIGQSLLEVDAPWE